MTFKAVIIEDEPAAARRLEKLIHEIDTNIEIQAKPDSVATAIEWFQKNTLPDLIFLDIHLGDGLSFAIVDTLKITCPVIFTTAYDEYAIRAFKVNSVDYLLKPIKHDELELSIRKFKKHFQKEYHQTQDLKVLIESLKQPASNWKKRFVVNYGEKIKAIETSDIAYFMIMEKNTFLVTRGNRSFGINYSLEQLENHLDTNVFFRVNRKFIININAIENMFTWSRSRIKLHLNPPPPEDVIVSTDRTSHFKEWLNQ
ncbi:MAG: LytR/AlgR family response regulator transcription factor [Bacteroidales bacterium]